MYNLAPNEKTSTVMFYSHTAFVHGDLVTKEKCARQHLAANTGSPKLHSFVEDTDIAFRWNATQIRCVQRALFSSFTDPCFSSRAASG